MVHVFVASTECTVVAMDSAGSLSVALVNSAASAELSAPMRIKRNTACVRCRDAKVKCNASLSPSQPCLRCSKLGLDCVVDKGHKRTSRRSKLEELAAEVRNIKEAVVASAPSLALSPTVAAPSHSARELPFIHPGGGIALTYSTPSIPPHVAGPMPADGPARSPDFKSRPRPAGQVAQPRALGSSVFPGEDVDYYFDKYLEHFHSFMPILRVRDPDECYKAAPVLFWTVIVTACRRYARRESTFQFLVNAIVPEVERAMASAPLRPPVITALLILSTWSLPSIRFMADPTYIYTGLALNACLYLGLHTGKGGFLEFSGPRYRIHVSDEEATYLWAAANILSLRTSCFLGYPTTSPFTGKALQAVIHGTSPHSVPRGFSISLAAAKWTSGLLKTITASLEEGPGVSYHLLEQMEEDFARFQRSLHDGRPDIDDFILRATLLEVQIFYWMPLAEQTEQSLRRNLTRTFTTSEGLVRLALDLHSKSNFLLHAPHFIFRSLLLAGCTIISFLRSPYAVPSLISPGAADALVQDGIQVLRACSVQADDLPIRGSNVAEAYWSVRDRLPPWDISQMRTSNFKHRLGTSIVYDCLGRWKSDLESVRASGGDVPPAGRPADSYGTDDNAPTDGQSTDLGISDPLFRSIDWGSFMDDFEWNFAPSVPGLETVPAEG